MIDSSLVNLAINAMDKCKRWKDKRDIKLLKTG